MGFNPNEYEEFGREILPARNRLCYGTTILVKGLK